MKRCFFVLINLYYTSKEFLKKLQTFYCWWNFIHCFLCCRCCCCLLGFSCQNNSCWNNNNRNDYKTNNNTENNPQFFSPNCCITKKQRIGLLLFLEVIYILCWRWWRVRCSICFTCHWSRLWYFSQEIFTFIQYHKWDLKTYVGMQQSIYLISITKKKWGKSLLLLILSMNIWYQLRENIQKEVYLNVYSTISFCYKIISDIII